MFQIAMHVTLRTLLLGMLVQAINSHHLGTLGRSLKARSTCFLCVSIHITKTDACLLSKRYSHVFRCVACCFLVSNAIPHLGYDSCLAFIAFIADPNYVPHVNLNSQQKKPSLTVAIAVVFILGLHCFRAFQAPVRQTPKRIIVVSGKDGNAFRMFPYILDLIGHCCYRCPISEMIRHIIMLCQRSHCVRHWVTCHHPILESFEAHADIAHIVWICCVDAKADCASSAVAEKEVGTASLRLLHQIQRRDQG